MVRTPVIMSLLALVILRSVPESPPRIWEEKKPSHVQSLSCTQAPQTGMSRDRGTNGPTKLVILGIKLVSNHPCWFGVFEINPYPKGLAKRSSRPETARTVFCQKTLLQLNLRSRHSCQKTHRNKPLAWHSRKILRVEFGTSAQVMGCHSQVSPTNSKKNKSTDAGPEWVNNLFPISWGIPWYTQYIGYFNMEHDYDIVKSNGFSKLHISSTRTPGSGRRPQVPHQSSRGRP